MYFSVKMAAVAALAAIFGTATANRHVNGEAGTGSYKFDSHFHLSWAVTGPNITFAVTCREDKAVGPLSWCAWGINTAGNARMYPAEVFWFGLTAEAEPYLEDRILTAIATPACATTQLSYMLDSYVSKGAISANFTRPLNVDAALQNLGYTNITNTQVQIIGGMGSGPRQKSTCDTIEVEHYVHYNNIQLNFLA